MSNKVGVVQILDKKKTPLCPPTVPRNSQNLAVFPTTPFLTKYGKKKDGNGKKKTEKSTEKKND